MEAKESERLGESNGGPAMSMVRPLGWDFVVKVRPGGIEFGWKREDGGPRPLPRVLIEFESESPGKEVSEAVRSGSRGQDPPARVQNGGAPTRLTAGDFDYKGNGIFTCRVIPGLTIDANWSIGRLEAEVRKFGAQMGSHGNHWNLRRRAKLIGSHTTS
jgi:hypothetical protein